MALALNSPYYDQIKWLLIPGDSNEISPASRKELFSELRSIRAACVKLADMLPRFESHTGWGSRHSTCYSVGPLSEHVRQSIVHSIIAILEITSSLLADVEGDLLAWIMKAKELERLYERFRCLYYRLAVFAIAGFWSYSEFPGGIRPPCTTMPWTIWPALVVLWGVCWMFYPSPEKAPGETELESQPQLECQSQDEEPGELLLSELDRVHPISHPFWDSSFSGEWWATHQLNTIHDHQTMTMNHDTAAWPLASTGQVGPMATFNPQRGNTNHLNLDLTTLLTLAPTPEQQPQSQESREGISGVANTATVAASGHHATNKFQCPDCGKVLSRHDSLKRHQEKQHNREVVEHLCPHKPCKRSKQGSGFSRPDGLRRHLKACKSQRRWAATRALEYSDQQSDSGNETREDSQARSSSHDTRSTEHAGDTSNQQSSADSLILGLRKRLAEAEAARGRAKHEYEEAQRKVTSYEITIEMLEKENTA